jgi:hypothetical protein
MVTANEPIENGEGYISSAESWCKQYSGSYNSLQKFHFLNKTLCLYTGFHTCDLTKVASRLLRNIVFRQKKGNGKRTEK